MKDLHDNRDVLAGSAYPNTDRLIRIEKMLKQAIAVIAEVDERLKRYTAQQEVFDAEFGGKKRCVCGWSAEDTP